MDIAVETWSQEDEEKYQRLLIDQHLKNAIPTHDQEWFDKARANRDNLLRQLNPRSSDRPIDERLHYRWIDFYLRSMTMAAKAELSGREKRAAWLILLQAELDALKEWKPVLSRAHSLRRHGFLGLRAEFIMLARYQPGTELITLNTNIDKNQLPKAERGWELLWEERKNRCSTLFPILSEETVGDFRIKAIKETYRLTYEAYPAFRKGQLKHRHLSAYPNLN
jgi:hypothetical protein